MRIIMWVFFGRCLSGAGGGVAVLYGVTVCRYTVQPVRGGVQRGERPPGESRGERSGKLPFSACGKWYNLLYHFDKWARLCYNRLDNDFQGGVG